MYDGKCNVFDKVTTQPPSHRCLVSELFVDCWHHPSVNIKNVRKSKKPAPKKIFSCTYNLSSNVIDQVIVFQSRKAPPPSLCKSY